MRSLLISILLALAVVSPAGAAERPRMPDTGHDAAAVDARPGERIGWLKVPLMGIDRAVYYWGCRGGTLPHRIYLWDCGARNHFYLLGHASSVFKPYRRSYLDGRLKPGAVLYFRFRNGTNYRYTLRWVRAYDKHKLYNEQNNWILGSTERPTVTLHTCHGPNDSQRLIARFER
jgi:hypothetical protein